MYSEGTYPPVTTENTDILNKKNVIDWTQHCHQLTEMTEHLLHFHDTNSQEDG